MKNKTINFLSSKVLLILGFVISISTCSLAQSYEEEIDMIQAVFGMEKKAIMYELIDNDADAAFWTLYDQYEVERKLLGKKRLELLNNYARNYAIMTDEKAHELMKQIMVQKKSLDKLIDKYYKKIRKSSGTYKAAQFYQLENYILSAIRLEILDSIEFFEELIREKFHNEIFKEED